MSFLFRICAFFFFMFLGFVAFAQPGGPPTSIKGQISTEDNEPLAYVTLTAFSSSDSSLAGGGITDETGKFSFALKPGNYFFQVKLLSFEQKQLENIEVGDKPMDLGTINLVVANVDIDEVEIRAEKSTMTLKLDKRVFNVGQDLGNSGKNASEILDNIPSVTVDMEGAVSLRGSENVRILIDGKPSALVGAGDLDALRQMQGSQIDKVEVITNPSSRFDAEGEVGIINIVLKKDTRRGVNGGFEISAGYPHNYQGSINLNYRTDKVNLFGSYGIGYRSTPGAGYSIQNFEIFDTTTGALDTSFSYEYFRNHTRGGLGNNVRVGSDFFLPHQQTITVSGLYRYAFARNAAKLEYLDFNQAGELTQTVTRLDSEGEIKQNIEAGFRYEKRFKRKDQLLTFDFKWVQSDDTETNEITQDADTLASPILQRADNIEDESTWLIQADYIHPFLKTGKFEAGIKTTLRNIENEYGVEEQQDDASWELVPGFNDHFLYTENIYAGYLMASHQSGPFSYQAGLRAEYSQIRTELLKTGEDNPRNYLNFFPSAHFSWKINESKTIQLSYSRRLTRPRFRHLIPFYSYSDNRNIVSGNPDLNPEYTHSTEIGYLQYFSMGSLLSSVYYRYKTGVIQRITFPELNGNTLRMPINMASQHAFGLEFNLSLEPTKWMRLTANANFYRAITEGDFQGQNFDADTYSGTGRISSKFFMPKDFDAQLTFDYRGPAITTQGLRRSMYSLDIGISKDFLKGKATLTLTGRDIFNTRKRRFYTEEAGYTSDGFFQWRARQFLLTFSYRINQKKKRNNQVKEADNF